MTTGPYGFRPPMIQIFWHGGNHIAARLRGLPLYQGMAGIDEDALYFDAVTSHEHDDPERCENCGEDVPGSRIRVVSCLQLPNLHGEIIPTGSVVRAVNPGGPLVPEVLRRLRVQGFAVIVDVHMPVDHPEVLFGMPEDEPELQHLADEMTRDAWRLDGPARASLIESLGVADLITTSNEYFAADLLNHAPPEKVHILPDFAMPGETFPDEAIAYVEDYTAQYGAIMRHALVHRWPTHPASRTIQSQGMGMDE